MQSKDASRDVLVTRGMEDLHAGRVHIEAAASDRSRTAETRALHVHAVARDLREREVGLFFGALRVEKNRLEDLLLVVQTKQMDLLRACRRVGKRVGEEEERVRVQNRKVDRFGLRPSFWGIEEPASSRDARNRGKTDL